MRPIPFNGVNVVYAENQPEYLPLPSHKDKDGMVVSCWQLSLWDSIVVAFTGRLWLSCLTFNQPLQPLLPQVTEPRWEDK